jgi:hypothetical protein
LSLRERLNAALEDAVAAGDQRATCTPRLIRERLH